MTDILRILSSLYRKNMRQLHKKEVKKLKESLLSPTKDIVLILENIEYARNVASIFRTADATGVKKIYLTSSSARPPFGKDLAKVSRAKERSISWEYLPTTYEVIEKLKPQGFLLVAVELTDQAVTIKEFVRSHKDHGKICFIFGSEKNGVYFKTLERCDTSTYIPMYGYGSSLNVSVSVGVVLYLLQLN